MAYTSAASESRLVALDEGARALVTHLLPHISAGYTPPPRRPYRGEQPPPAEVVDEAYVLTGALRIGLNRWTLPGSEIPRPELFFTKQGNGVALAPVDVAHDDVSRAELLSDHLAVPVEHILSCAVCTGLAMLAGDHKVHGPFEA